FAVLLAFGGGLGERLTLSQAIETARLCAAWLASITLLRLLWGLGCVRGRLVRRVLLLGDTTRAAAFDARLQSRRGRTFEPVTMPLREVSWQTLRRHRVWGLVITSGIDEPTADSALDCKLRGIPVLSGAAFHE